ncbi:MAG TPA: NAD-dependent epimerase/dehydratase family protein [Paenibacillus sp.]|nr:NAD-dependent epimerase/dehydratase family protein [Paenibacillus sp.]
MTSTGRCLVTGGAGFIGSHVVKRLLNEGYEATVLDTQFGGAVIQGVRYVKGSVTDAALVERLVKENDHVFHLAARLGVKTTMDAPAEMIENNVQGTINILQSASKHRRKVVFASSSEVYGKALPPFREDDDLLYGPTTKLRWSYATAKLLEEFLCLGYGRKGLPVTVVRYFNVYGPGQKGGPYGGAIPKFIRAALAGDDITVYGDGTQTRCFTYVEDAAEATVRALRREADNEIINIGTEHEIPILEVARLVQAISKSPSRIVKVPYEKVYPNGFEEIPRRLPNVDKMKTLLAFRPKVDIGVGLSLTLQWYRNHGVLGGGD